MVRHFRARDARNALPSKTLVGELNGDDYVGIDLGIQNYIYTTDNNSVDCLDLIEEYDRLRREQRSFSRKQQGSNNWEQQRQQKLTT